jgi:hypothetical protein
MAEMFQPWLFLARTASSWFRLQGSGLILLLAGTGAAATGPSVLTSSGIGVGGEGWGMGWEERLSVGKMKWKEEHTGSVGFKATGG